MSAQENNQEFKNVNKIHLISPVIQMKYPTKKAKVFGEMIELLHDKLNDSNFLELFG